MPETVRVPLPRSTAVAGLAAGATLLGLVLAGVRIAGSISFETPFQVITSGWEQQTLFEIWRYTQGLDLYMDYTRIPYYSAFYNWLFYVLYGTWTSTWLGGLGLGDAWLPTVGRVLTLVAAPAGIAVLWPLFRRCGGERGRWLSLAFAVSVMTGPLVGFWIVTVRADLWAMVVESLAIAVFLRFWPARPARAVLSAAVLCYLAWSLKQANVFVAAAIGLFLLAERRFPWAAVFGGLLAAAFAATFAVASPWYFPSMFRVVLGAVMETGLHNMVNFSAKMLPQLLGAVALAVAIARLPASRRAALSDPDLRFAVIGAVVTTAMAMAGAFKEGGSESYYFVPSVFLTLAVLAGWRILHATHAAAAVWAGRVMAAGWLVHAALICGVLAGWVGAVSVRGQHVSNMAGRACIEALPKPVLTLEQSLQLPWINPSRPVLFPSYNYARDRAAGLDFEGGGLGGMVERGVFATLLIPEATDSVDGGDVARHYDPQSQACGGRMVYRRRDGG